MEHILTIGVGGAGCMIAAQLHRRLGGRAVAVNTDPDGLEQCELVERLLIGEQERCEGFSGRLDSGGAAAEAATDALRELFQGARYILVTAGLGGRTGTGVGPVIARLAGEQDIPVIAAVTLPFPFEGARRREIALAGLRRLEAQAIEVVVLDHAERFPKAGGGLLEYFDAALGELVEQTVYRARLYWGGSSSR